MILNRQKLLVLRYVVSLLFLGTIFGVKSVDKVLAAPEDNIAISAATTSIKTLQSESFPLTGIIDDFNRTDGSLDENWSGDTANYSIAANQLRVGISHDIYWNASYFGVNQEAFVTLVEISSEATEIGLVLKAQNNTAISPGLIDVVYIPSGNYVQVWTYTNNSDDWRQHGTNIPVTFMAGDQFGARAKENGEVEVYQNGTLIGIRDVGSWSYFPNGGYIGLLTVNASDSVLDDFGGGTLPSPPPACTDPTACDPVSSVPAFWRCDIPECSGDDWVGTVIAWPSWSAYENNARSGNYSRTVYSSQDEKLYPYMGPWANGCQVTAISGNVLIIEWERGTDTWNDTLLSPGESHTIELISPEDGAMLESPNDSSIFSVSLNNCNPENIYTVPSASITTNISSPTNTSPIPVTITFSESVSNFTIDDISVSNGAASNFSGSNAAYSVDITPTGDGMVTVDVAADVVQDSEGNGNTAATQLSIIYDTTAPETTIESTTPSTTPTNSTSMRVTFSSNEGNSAFQCKLDSASYTSCTSPVNFTGLSDGSHTFYVYATDATGNADVSPASYTWTVDTTAPNTTIESTTPSITPTNSTSMGVIFSSNEGSSTFQCKLDSASYTPCTSPVNFTSLSDGSHTFYVYATDAAGNADVSPASYTWTVDTTASETTIESTTPSITPTNSTSMGVTFSSNEGSSTFQCKLDSALYTSCTSPVNYTDLSDGSHTFYVYATDAVGNADLFPASYTWTVDTIAPNVSIGSPNTSLTTSGPVDYSITVSGADTINLTTSDITLNKTGTASGTVSVSDGITASPTVSINNIAGDGTIGISITAGIASDSPGNTSPAVGPSVTFAVDNTAPNIASITRADTNPTNASSVDFTVIFSETVTGVNATDFTLSTTGLISTFITSVNGADDTYTVTVGTGFGDGTIRLDVIDDNTIVDGAHNPLGGNSLDDGDFTGGETYTISKGATFEDVPTTYWAWSFIERLYNAGITGGCNTSPLQYCPETTVTRDQMAVFLLRGIHGASYTPPLVGTNTGFADVPTNYWAAPWIKELAAEGITGGCGGGNYCPTYPVTRDQMAVFLLRSKYGVAYSPPAAGSTTGFGDVPTDYWAAAWIKQLVTEGITAGCGGGNYCPSSPVTRDQMAVFLVRTFGIPLP